VPDDRLQTRNRIRGGGPADVEAAIWAASAAGITGAQEALF
jgi:hypothetical protein